MKVTASIFFFTIFCIFCYSQESSIIEWDETRKLKLSDYHGVIGKNETIGQIKTVYKIEIFPSNVQVDSQDRVIGYKQLTAKAIFFKNKSWVAAEENLEQILQHEQLHFNIAELYARRLRKRFQELKNKGERSFTAYAKAYSLLWNRCLKLQAQCNLETDYGQIHEQNKVWAKKVIDELEYYSAYR